MEHSRRTCSCWKRIWVVIGLLLISILLVGCKATELEDRSFPMMAIVDYDDMNQVGFVYIFPVLRAEPDAATEAGDNDVDMVYAKNFTKAFTEYEMSLNKEADYNHLKVILLSTSFLKNEENYNEMLNLLWEEETFPRNTYVCVTDDVSSVLAMKENYSVDLGTYVEELLENHEFGEETVIPTLGMLMDEQKNQVLSLKIPFLSIKDKTIVWDGFFDFSLNQTE